MERVFEGYKATCDRWDGLVRCASNKGVSRVWGSESSGEGDGDRTLGGSAGRQP